MESGEEKIKQEDCSEDSLGSGILTLTNRRLAFDKSKGRIMDFSKRFEETVLDVRLGDVDRVWNEGRFIKKVCFSVMQDGTAATYKFGVFNTGDWLETIQDAIHDYTHGEAAK